MGDVTDTLPTPGPCTPPCWTETRCERCGRIESPRGRDAGYAAGGYCACPDVRGYAGTARHLWDEHDPERWRFDPDGEREHMATCSRCRPEDDE